ARCDGDAAGAAKEPGDVVAGSSRTGVGEAAVRAALADLAGAAVEDEEGHTNVLCVQNDVVSVRCDRGVRARRALDLMAAGGRRRAARLVEAVGLRHEPRRGVTAEDGVAGGAADERVRARRVEGDGGRLAEGGAAAGAREWPRVAARSVGSHGRCRATRARDRSRSEENKS